MTAQLHCPTPCAICPNSDTPGKVVNNDGPDTASTLWIGEGPGYWEDRSSIPFVGKTGKEFNHLLLPNYARLSRKSIKICNAVSCFFGGDNQTPDQARTCAVANVAPLIQSMPHLRHVILMGATACSILSWAAVDAETGASVPVPPLMTEHGLPVNRGRPILLFGRKLHAIALLHPALTLHQTSAMGEVIEDFRNVHDWRTTGWTGPQDEIGDAVCYEEVSDSDPAGIERWRRRLLQPVVALDTELDSRRRPWCSQLSARKGQGCLARSDQPAALAMMQEVLDQAQSVLISFAKHDLPVVAEMGLELDVAKVVDTVLLARQLGLPAGIKALARRLAGMEMDSWEEITGAQFEADCLEWLMEAEKLVGEEVSRREKAAHTQLRELADASVPPDAKNRKAQVNKEFKQLLWQLEEERGDTWRPPIEYYDRAGKPTRRRAKGFHKWIDAIVCDHARSLEGGGGGVDFQKRWFGDSSNEDSIGTRDRLPVWASQILRRELGDFPRRGLDQAPYEQALHYACRDVDSLIRVWPHLDRRAQEIERKEWEL